MASLSTCHLELVVWDGNLVKYPKFFYKYARPQLKVKETITPTEDEHGNIVINDNLKTATTFNNHFVTQFTQENLDRIPNPVKMFHGSSEEELNSITFEESSLCNKLKKLNASKSPGTDQIFRVVLKNLPGHCLQRAFKVGRYHTTGLMQMPYQFTRKDTIPSQETTGQLA